MWGGGGGGGWEGCWEGYWEGYWEVSMALAARLVVGYSAALVRASESSSASCRSVLTGALATEWTEE